MGCSGDEAFKVQIDDLKKEFENKNLYYEKLIENLADKNMQLQLELEKLSIANKDYKEQNQNLKNSLNQCNIDIKKIAEDQREIANLKYSISKLEKENEKLQKKTLNLIKLKKKRMKK